MEVEIADLHCDLLSYLADDESRTPFNEEARCSVPQLQKGRVFFQTMAIFTQTEKQAVRSAQKQFEIFCTLPNIYPQTFAHLTSLQIPKPDGRVYIALAIENASGLCDENESLEKGFIRFSRYQTMGGPIIYISLTWNQENRFAGGNLSKVGLKRDGELFLEYLEGKRSAIDLSHTSDRSAYDILNYIDKKGLKVIPIASHSNFRAICNQPRNLPDEIAQEILKRRGVIGLNFFKAFVGKNLPDDFMRQVEYARSVGALNQFCFGADFFYDQQLPTSFYPPPFYYKPFSNAGCYPHLITYLNEILSQKEIEQIAHENLRDFFEILGAS